MREDQTVNIQPICEETMVLVSLVSDPLASWYLVLVLTVLLSLHCQVFLFTPIHIRMFLEKAKAIKAQQTVLCFWWAQATWGTAALLILKFVGKNSMPNLQMEDWPCLQSSECFSRSHGFAWRYLEVSLRWGYPQIIPNWTIYWNPWFWGSPI